MSSDRERREEELRSSFRRPERLRWRETAWACCRYGLGVKEK